MGKFVITKSDNGEFRFTLKAGNGETILTSEGYTTKANCENGIASVKTNSSSEERYEKLISKNEKFYFNLKATNGQVIGTSQMYASAAGRDGGIAAVKSIAADAGVDDESL